MKTLTPTAIQKSISTLSSPTQEGYIVVSRGKPSRVILPYFTGNELYITAYMEGFKKSNPAESLAREYEKMWLDIEYLEECQSNSQFLGTL